VASQVFIVEAHICSGFANSQLQPHSKRCPAKFVRLLLADRLTSAARDRKWRSTARGDRLLALQGMQSVSLNDFSGLGETDGALGRHRSML
jgi:hypothetical protein